MSALIVDIECVGIDTASDYLEPIEAPSNYKDAAKIDIQHIPYKSNSLADAAILGGQVEAVFGSMPALLQNAKAGKVKPIAVGTPKRMSYLPDIPTAAEAGLPGYEVTTWFALFAPKGTPRPILEWLNAAVREMNADQEAARRLTDVNIDPMIMTLDAFGARVKADAARWERIIRDAGVKTE